MVLVAVVVPVVHTDHEEDPPCFVHAVSVVQIKWIGISYKDSLWSLLSKDKHWSFFHSIRTVDFIPLLLYSKCIKKRFCNEGGMISWSKTVHMENWLYFCLKYCEPILYRNTSILIFMLSLHGWVEKINIDLMSVPTWSHNVLSLV